MRNLGYSGSVVEIYSPVGDVTLRHLAIVFPTFR